MIAEHFKTIRKLTQAHLIYTNVFVVICLILVVITVIPLCSSTKGVTGLGLVPTPSMSITAASGASIDTQATNGLEGTMSGSSDTVTVQSNLNGLFDYQLGVRGTIPDVSFHFATCGAPQTFIAPADGNYKLEAWGAQGGGSLSDEDHEDDSMYEYEYYLFGGIGGYATGELALEQGDELYVYVGCRGTNSAGGWNGGGDSSAGTNYNDSGAGGGATDFRLIKDNNPLDPVTLNSRILVAGGGGGIYCDEKEFWYCPDDVYGGSEIGYAGRQDGMGDASDGNLATSGGFGYGASSTNVSDDASGGGGGWYGGNSAGDLYGGGGSNYALTSTSFKPAGYNPDPKYYLTNSETVSINYDCFPSPPSISADHDLYGCASVGDGYALITLADGYAGTMLHSDLIHTISPINAGITTPTQLAVDTWGYAIAGNPTSTTQNKIVNNFDTTYTLPTPFMSSKWAGLTGDLTTIKKSPATTAGSSTTIYYGLKSNTNTPIGKYKANVVYDVTPDLTAFSLPTVESVTPAVIPGSVSTQITIVGTNFTSSDLSITTAVSLGGISCTNVSISSNTPSTGKDTITCMSSPSLGQGTISVTVRNFAGAATAMGAITTLNVPTVTSISPTSGIANTTGATITVTGNYYRYPTSSTNRVTSVTVGGEACVSFTVTSATQLTCTLPAFSTTGDKVVKVTTIGGTNTSNIMYNVALPLMQTVTNANCPTSLSSARDARNSQLYYIQKLADGRCWMMSNLRYGGGGTNTYSDVKTLSLSSTTSSYTTPYYYNPGGSTDYTNTTYDGGFYGYLYNWCAAMGGQTNACNNTNADLMNVDPSVSVCPAGWRLPIDWLFFSGETKQLVSAISDGTNSQFRDNWLVTGAGYFNGSQVTNDVLFIYWTSMLWNSTGSFVLRSDATGKVNGAGFDGFSTKSGGASVRCILKAPPTITSVSPTSGSTNGGTEITITGTNFQDGFNTVTVGGATCKSSGSLYYTDTYKCLVPAHAKGTVSVVITTPDGTYTKTNAFTYFTMQSFTAAQCAALSTNASLNATDTRDGKIYKIRKMADGKCWMVDNLAFDLANSAAPAYSPAAGLVSGTNTSVDTQAQYFLNSDHSTTAGDITYLYNWCAAMGDTSTNCATTLAYATNQPAGSVQGICPTGWRLPRGGDEATTSGDAGTTANEFAILDIAFGGKGQTGHNGGSEEGDSDSYWRWRDDWYSVDSGIYRHRFTTSGGLSASFGAWLSSSALGNLVIFSEYFSQLSDDPYIGFNYNYYYNNLALLPISAKSTAGAVRCVLR
jgi:uncharacterized protein (TIGR02145 family)